MAVIGQTITLPCRAPGNISIIAVTWTRPDLKTKYVLLFQNGKIVPDNQQPSFKNRVNLKDKQMKNGDLSLILKDVKISDIGTYECRYKERKGTTVTTSGSVSTINLTVPLSGGFDHFRISFVLQTNIQNEIICLLHRSCSLKLASQTGGWVSI